MPGVVQGVTQRQAHARRGTAQFFERGELDIERGARTRHDTPNMPALEKLTLERSAEVVLGRFGPAPVLVVAELGPVQPIRDALLQVGRGLHLTEPELERGAFRLGQLGGRVSRARR